MLVIFIIGLIAIMAVFVADLIESTTTDFHVATAERDRLKAEYLAKSGLNLTRLLIGHEKEIRAIVTPSAAHTAAHELGHNYGLFHATNEGSCSWFEFARAIFDLTKIDAELSPTSTSAYKSPAARPAYSVLENARLKELGLNRMRDWREALAAYLKDKSLGG